MTYLLIGETSYEKDQKIADIKNKHLVKKSSSQNLTVESVEFDFETLHGHKLDSAEFKKSLLALPTFASARVILIRELQKFSPQNKEILLDFLSQKSAHIVFILDAGKVERKNAFIDKVRAFAKVSQFGYKRSPTVFNMFDCLLARQPEQALKILSDLFEGGSHPLAVLGGLIWSWGKNKNRFSHEAYQKGLVLFQQTDMNIKRSRLNPQQAMEVAVVKLGVILA